MASIESHRRAHRGGGAYLWYSLGTLGLFVLTGAAVLTFDSVLLCIPFAIGQGLAVIAFSNAAHECTHGNFMRTLRGNHVVGALWMLPILLVFIVHRRYHLDHHRHTAQPDDPEGTFAYTRTRSIAPYIRGALRWTVFPSPLHCLNWYHSALAIAGRPSAWCQRAEDRRLVAWNAAALTVWIIGMSAATLAAHWLLWVYWLPVCVVGPFLAWFTALPRHVGAGSSTEPVDNTRTVRTTRLLQAILWNFNLHTAHHAFPGEPFHRLPAIDSQLRAEIRHQTSGYFAFHVELVRSLWSGRPLGATRAS